MQDECGVAVELRPGAKGSFEVHSGGRLLHSKLTTGRFPEPEEIAAQLG